MIGILYSDNTQTAVDIVVRKIHLLLLPLGFLIVNKKIPAKQLHFILLVFLAAGILFTLVCLFTAAYNTIRSESSPLLHTPQENYSYFFFHAITEPFNIAPVYLSMYCSFSLLIALDTDYIKKSVYKIIIVVYLAIFIVLCRSNAGIISIIVLFSLWLWTSSYKKTLLFSLAILFGVVSIFAFKDLSYFKKRFFNTFKFDYMDEGGQLSNYTADKLLIWESAIKTIRENPLTGYGTSDGKKALEATYLKNNLIREKEDELNPHNEFLSTILDIGIPGFLILAVMIILPLVQSIKAKDAITIGFLFVVILFFSVESVLVRQKGIVFFSFFYALLFSTPRTD